MQACVNRIKATVTELETADEEQIDDITSLVTIYFLFASKRTQQ